MTRAHGSINSHKASSLDVSAVSKKKKIIWAKKTEESNVARERLPRTSPNYSSSLDSSLSEMSASLKPRCGTCSWVCFRFVEGRFSFRFILCWPRLKRVRLKRDCNTIAFPRSSSLHTYTVSTRGSVQFHDWLAADTFLCEGGYVYKSLEGENSHSFFKWILSL